MVIPAANVNRMNRLIENRGLSRNITPPSYNRMQLPYARGGRRSEFGAAHSGGSSIVDRNRTNTRYDLTSRASPLRCSAVDFSWTWEQIAFDHSDCDLRVGN